MLAVFTDSKGPFAELIKWKERGEWSHVAVCFAPNRAIEATFLDGVRDRRFDSLLADRPDHLILNIPLPNDHAAHEFALAQVGKRYDWTGVFGLGFDRNWEDPSMWYCSELFAACMKAGGLKLPRSGEVRMIGVQPSLEIAFSHGAQVVSRT